ncbi:MAG: enterochelin esterase-like enzyme [Kiritimatiellia bacterium]|jgi:enterochelin esterase-like enzyme
MITPGLIASAFAEKKENKPPAKGVSIVWVNEIKAGETLPPHTQHLTFKSEAAQQEVGYCIYLPPGYGENPEQRYPVIYNLHGNGGNEFTGLYDIRVLHKGIES